MIDGHVVTGQNEQSHDRKWKEATPTHFKALFLGLGNSTIRSFKTISKYLHVAVLGCNSPKYM